MSGRIGLFCIILLVLLNYYCYYCYYYYTYYYYYENYDYERISIVLVKCVEATLGVNGDCAIVSESSGDTGAVSFM